MCFSSAVLVPRMPILLFLFQFQFHAHACITPLVYFCTFVVYEFSQASIDRFISLHRLNTDILTKELDCANQPNANARKQADIRQFGPISSIPKKGDTCMILSLSNGGLLRRISILHHEHVDQS
jgi:hypothetical protein